ncbi:MAG TPA: 50S ribosomal protein L25/general stress protein Ctc [Anaeromyxobacteraceae bacterium]|nr:50S ribosomal protein L25/general stress protein Ctc [Anaeromyxobacteraceae bacterium]
MAQSTNELSAKLRQERGKGPARRLRAQGLIPAVVYGQKREPTHVAVDPAAITKAIATPHKLNTLITLKVDGADKRVLLREYEVDPVSRELLHADFLEVVLGQAVKVDVPIVTTGKAEGVVAGGILTVSAHDIAVEALPDRIPVAIEVDVTPLKIGGSIHIADVKAPEGVKIKYATNFTVAVVTAPEKEEVVAAPVAAVPAEGAVPGAAPAAGAPAGAPGAAPAAGAPAGAPGAAPAAGAAAGAPAAAAKPEARRGKK